MNFASQEQIRQMGRRCFTFKRASEVAGGIGRVAADSCGSSLSFVSGSRGEAKGQNNRGLERGLV